MPFVLSLGRLKNEEWDFLELSSCRLPTGDTRHAAAFFLLLAPPSGAASQSDWRRVCSAALGAWRATVANARICYRLADPRVALVADGVVAAAIGGAVAAAWPARRRKPRQIRLLWPDSAGDTGDGSGGSSGWRREEAVAT